MCINRKIGAVFLWMLTAAGGGGKGAKKLGRNLALHKQSTGQSLSSNPDVGSPPPPATGKKNNHRSVVVLLSLSANQFCQNENSGGVTGLPAKALGPGSDREKYIFAALVVPKS